jgi:hypothetical protein
MFARQLQHPEWLTDVPEDLQQNWWVLCWCMWVCACVYTCVCMCCELLRASVRLCELHLKR